MTSTTDHRKMNFPWTGNPVSTFWNNLNLTGKLFSMFGILGLLALLIGLVANRGLKAVQSSYEGAIFQGQAMASRSQLVANHLLTARSGEKDFLLYWKQVGFDQAYATHVAKHVNAVQTMKDHIKELYEFGPEVGRSLPESYSQQEYENDLKTLTEATHQYELNFLKTVDLIKVRGFRDTGLEGEFRVAVSNIEENIYDREGLEQIVISMLELRRHEKDYLLRGEQQYIDQVHVAAKELRSEIFASEVLSQEEKLEMSALTDQYVTAFDRLVQKDREIAVSTETYEAAALVMEPLVRKLSIAGANMSDIDVQRAQAASTQTLLYSSVTWVTALLLAAFLSIALARQITTPVTQLTAAARELQAGNFDVQIAATSRDEIGTLAAAFNTMVRQLKEAVALVTKRAVELQAVAEIATEASQISDVDRMLQTTVEKTKKHFNLYHAHIYLLDDSGTQLVLAAGAGEPGQRMVAEKRFIPLDREQSLVARAAREQRGVAVNDVTQAPDFLPNPLLPNTRSELAAPMIVGQQVIGVFDVQSDVVGHFTDADIAVQTTLAAQVASAVQNSRSYHEVQKRAEREALIASINQKIQSTSTVESALQVTVRELGRALGTQTSVTLAQSAQRMEHK